MSELEQLQERIKDLEKSNAYLQGNVEMYENGDANLYYSVKKKMSELAKILNKNKLEDVDIEDAKSKAFERIIGILEKCEKIAISANALGVRFGVERKTEPLDSEPIKDRKPYTPESAADEPH
jgi:predicted nuclease with TOPRIM domain